MEQDEAGIGPFELLSDAVEKGYKVIIACRNDRKLWGKAKAFDKHFNLILEDVTEVWSTKLPGGKVSNQTRHIGKMLIRGDSVISVVRPPVSEQTSE